MDRSRFDSYQLRFVSDPSEVEATGADVLFVDLDKCDDPAIYRLADLRVVGFGSHVDESRLVAARAAGFDEVLPRSVFFRTFPTLMSDS